MSGGLPSLNVCPLLVQNDFVCGRGRSQIVVHRGVNYTHSQSRNHW